MSLIPSGHGCASAGAQKTKTTRKSTIRVRFIYIASFLCRFISFCRCRVERKRGTIERVKRYWEIIADNLSKAGWSWGCVSALNSSGRTIWIVDAHRDETRRFVVRADELLTAFCELERAVRQASRAR